MFLWTAKSNKVAKNLEERIELPIPITRENEYQVNFCVMKYHEYRKIWIPKNNELALADLEPGNVVGNFPWRWKRMNNNNCWSKRKTKRFSKAILYFLQVKINSYRVKTLDSKAANLRNGLGWEFRARFISMVKTILYTFLVTNYASIIDDIVTLPSIVLNITLNNFFQLSSHPSEVWNISDSSISFPKYNVLTFSMLSFTDKFWWWYLKAICSKLLKILYKPSTFKNSVSIHNRGLQVLPTLHRKWSFPVRISSVNLTKSAVSCGFSHIY